MQEIYIGKYRSLFFFVFENYHQGGHRDDKTDKNNWLSEKDWEFYYTVIKFRFLVMICGIDFNTAYQKLEREKTPTIGWGF